MSLAAEVRLIRRTSLRICRKIRYSSRSDNIGIMSDRRSPLVSDPDPTSGTPQVFLALRDAAATDPDSAALWSEITGRRARNLREFATDLRATGELRNDLSDSDVADIVWSMNGPEYWILLVGERGWTHERFAAYLVDAWTRLLLDRPNHTVA